MPGIIFPMSGSVFRMIFFIKKHNSMLNYFPNEWHLKTSQEHIYFPMECFSFPMTYSGFPMFSTPESYPCRLFLLFILIQEQPFPVLKNRKNKHQQLQAEAP